MIQKPMRKAAGPAPGCAAPPVSPSRATVKVLGALLTVTAATLIASGPNNAISLALVKLLFVIVPPVRAVSPITWKPLSSASSPTCSTTELGRINQLVTPVGRVAGVCRHRGRDRIDVERKDVGADGGFVVIGHVPMQGARPRQLGSATPRSKPM